MILICTYMQNNNNSDIKDSNPNNSVWFEICTASVISVPDCSAEEICSRIAVNSRNLVCLR